MKRTLYSGVGLLLVGLLFLAFNLLSSLLLRDQQFDLTQQKLYTFSAGTQEVLDSLDEPLNLYLFFSKSRASDLPTLRNYARRIEEVLDLYARRSHGNVRLFVIDPCHSPTTRTVPRASACKRCPSARMAKPSTLAWRPPMQPTASR